jgi:hypothetical protein
MLPGNVAAGGGAEHVSAGNVAADQSARQESSSATLPTARPSQVRLDVSVLHSQLTGKDDAVFRRAVKQLAGSPSTVNFLLREAATGSTQVTERALDCLEALCMNATDMDVECLAGRLEGSVGMLAKFIKAAADAPKEYDIPKFANRVATNVLARGDGSTLQKLVDACLSAGNAASLEFVRAAACITGTPFVDALLRQIAARGERICTAVTRFSSR